MTYFRPEIEAMAGYVPGEQPQAGKFIKLNTNENPYPPSPRVVRAIQQAAEAGLMRYPDPMGNAFRDRAADVLGVQRDWILCGNGSDDILTIVTRAFVGTRERLRLPYPSYILYRTLAQLQGANWEEVRFRRRLEPAARIRRRRPGPEAGLPAQSEQPDWDRGFLRRHPATWPSSCLVRSWWTRPTSILPTRTA